jgi:FkbM family methyltransferase
VQSYISAAAWRQTAIRGGCPPVTSTATRSATAGIHMSRPLLRRLLRGIAYFTRHHEPRGTDRLLRILHSPNRRGRWSIHERVRLPDGATVDVDTASWVEWRTFFFGGYEPGVTAVLREQLRNGNIAIDVGANIGLHSLTMAGLVGPTGQVIACEPNPSVGVRLRRNLMLNPERRIVALEVAVSDREGSGILAVPAASDPNQGRANLGVSRGEGWLRLTTPTVTIDSLVEELHFDSVSLIKIDVEGSEPAVLRGASSTLLKHRPVLIFEYTRSYWRDSGASADQVLQFLRDHGYERLYAVTRRGSEALGGDPPDGDVLALPM